MDMRNLIVKNFGPIKDANLQLKQYSFFIGGTGVGKSALAKLLGIVSDYHLYLCLAGVDGGRGWSDFLVDYGIDGYVTENSCIEYRESGRYFDIEDNMKEKDYSISLHVEGDNVRFEMTSSQTVVTGNDVVPIFSSLMARGLQWDKPVLYIPAGRIMHASFYNLLPVLSLVKETVTAAMLHFTVEYNSARAHFKEYSIPFLGVGFEHMTDDDYVILHDGRRVPVKTASSGIQSTIPLLLTLHYAINEKHCKSFVVEEPESFLFPKNQLLLMDRIFQLLKDSGSTLTVTTHSPYIINYLNLLMRRHRRGLGSGIQPDKLAVYSVNDSGCTVNLMAVDNHTGEPLVNTTDLSETMAGIFSEYTRLK